KKIKALYDTLQVDSVARLKEVCASGEVAALAGFGNKTAEKLLGAITFRESNAERFRLGDVVAPVEEILNSLKGHPDCLRAETAGSYRRAKETVHDIDFLVATANPEGIIDHFVAHPRVTSVIAKGGTKASVYL